MVQTLIDRSDSGARRVARHFLVLTAVWVLFVASLAADQLFSSAWLWPADAVLAGVLVRYRLVVKPVPCWLAVGAGLILAYLFWGESLSAVANYALAHGVSVWVAWRLLSSAPSLSGLRRPEAVGRVLLAGMLAALLGTMAGAALSFLLSDAGFVFRSLVNKFLGLWLGYCAVLPAVLLLPDFMRRGGDRRRLWHGVHDAVKQGASWLPLAVLVVGLVLYFMLKGPGAVAFLMPGLLYGVFVYQLATEARLILMVVLVALLGLGPNVFDLYGIDMLGESGSWPLASLQIGLLLLVGSSLLLSSILAARNDLIAALNQALDHDELTDALSRNAFFRGTQEYLQQLPGSVHGIGLMMLDIDHFKKLNDTHGHTAGDTVLREFARVIQAALRPQDLFGRLGGEEFGVALPNTSIHDAVRVAERLRIAVEAIRLYYDSDEPIRISVSIGVVHSVQAPRAGLEALMQTADVAMYEAKRGGRNQVRVHGV